MTQSTNIPNQPPVPKHPFPAEEVGKPKQKAETLEVAGKHKHDGQKRSQGRAIKLRKRGLTYFNWNLRV